MLDASLVCEFVVGQHVGVTESLEVSIDSVSAPNSLYRWLCVLHLLIQDVGSLGRWRRIRTLGEAATRVENLIESNDFVLLLHLVELFMLG